MTWNISSRNSSKLTINFQKKNTLNISAKFFNFISVRKKNHRQGPERWLAQLRALAARVENLGLSPNSQ